jgi:hypothetical protein
METLHSKYVQVTIMLVVVADGNNFPPFMVLKCVTMPKEHLLSRVIVRLKVG